jgi:hypothetical protein
MSEPSRPAQFIQLGKSERHKPDEGPISLVEALATPKDDPFRDDPGGVPADLRIDDLSEAVQMLANAISQLAIALADDVALSEQANTALRMANAAERISERVLIGR